MLNSVQLQGRMTADAEIRYTQNGKRFVSFTIAVDSDTKEKKADFINCVAWEGKADFISKFFPKGKMIIISGKLKSNSYTAQNGDKRYVTDVVVLEANFAGDKAKTPDSANAAVAT